ncbi:SDR family oxidoreductase [Amycolatopsis sp. NBC_00345]|uniref:SDR family NAD(P)-dependent oxidoreductase n=1 Tax=Amycolatopsis sp. NBC_00345 TaxID=2975955 RepID=UPI002E2699DD
MRVLVTGGASGIGSAMVRRFVADGAQVAVLDWDKDALRELDATNPGSELSLLADVTDQQGVEDAFSRIDAAWDSIDVLLNNAGISIRDPFLDAGLEEWNHVLSVNLTGAFIVAQLAARRMMKAGSGVIVNTGSVSGMVGMPNYGSYNASKAGLIELTKTLALELAPAVRVNTICPGYVLTPMQEAEYTPEMLHEREQKVPLRRLGKPAEIAAMAAFLASPDAAFITGQSFVVDGGESAGGLASA